MTGAGQDERPAAFYWWFLHVHSGIWWKTVLDFLSERCCWHAITGCVTMQSRSVSWEKLLPHYRDCWPRKQRHSGNTQLEAAVCHRTSFLRSKWRLIWFKDSLPKGQNESSHYYSFSTKDTCCVSLNSTLVGFLLFFERSNRERFIWTLNEG